jgi:hypothetical protein
MGMKNKNHNARSISRISAITGNTVTLLTRQKTFYVVLLFALLLIGNSAFLTQFSFQQEFQVLKDIALGAMSIFSSLLAILATAQLIPRDFEDRTIYTILAKPVSRLEYLLGRLCGVLVLLAISMIFMSLLFVVVLGVREHFVLNDTLRQLSALPEEQVVEALRAVRRAAFNPNLFSGIVIIYLKSCLLAALTLFISTFASTTVFTTFVMAFAYFIGHLQSTARNYWLHANGTGWMTNGFLALVTLFFPDLQLFNLVDDIVVGTTIPTSLLMRTALLGSLYVGFYLFVAWLVFRRKPL